MKEQGIPTMVYYPKPLHFQQVYADLGYKPGDLPVSEALAQQVFSLPMHGYLTEDIIRTVCEALLKL